MSLSNTDLATMVALVAVLVARRGVAPATERSDVSRRLHMLYGLVAALLFLRVADRWLELSLLTAAIMAIAAWLPLAGLRLVEDLQRRHAPRWIKLGSLGGGLAFTVVAISLGLVWSAPALVALAAFQSIATLAMIGLLLSARHDLSRAERRTADTFLLALLLTIPLAVSDFEVLLPDPPLRGGPLAVLILVLATSRLLRRDCSPAWLAADIAICLGGAGLAAAIFLTLPGTPGEPLLWAAMTAGFLAVAIALLIERFAAMRLDEASLIGALARAPAGDGPETLLRSHPLLSSARIVDDALLASYPADSIRALTASRVIGEELGAAEAREAARDLLDATAATHLLRLSAEPPRFLAVSAGGLAGAAVNDELTIAAMLIERRS